MSECFFTSFGVISCDAGDTPQAHLNIALMGGARVVNFKFQPAAHLSEVEEWLPNRGFDI